MKTLRFLGMAIVAVMLSAFATSCDDDDDDDNSQPATSEDGVVVNQKKLVKIVEYEDDGSYVDIDSTVLRYDSKGRLIKWEKDNYGPYKYTWTEDTIAVQYSRGEYTIALSDNLVTVMTPFNLYYVEFQYDSDKRIATETIIDGRPEEYYYSWEDDKLVRFYRAGGSDYELHYSGKTCKGYNPSVAMGDFK